MGAFYYTEPLRAEKTSATPILYLLLLVFIFVIPFSFSSNRFSIHFPLSHSPRWSPRETIDISSTHTQQSHATTESRRSLVFETFYIIHYLTLVPVTVRRI